MNIRALSLIVFGFAIVLVANADSQPGKTTLFNCTNPAQATDAPSITITMDANGTQYVEFTARGGSSSIEITPSDNIILIDGIEFDGAGVTVREYNDVEDPTAQSTVNVSSLGLTYTCSRLQSH